MYRKDRPSKAIILSSDQCHNVNSSLSQNKKNHLKNDVIQLLDDDEVEIVERHSMNLPEVLQNRLFEHQKYGVDWLYRAYKEVTGGILGDDMGLGKTFQVCCLLCGLFRDQRIRKVLVVSPVSVITSWFREINEHIKPYVNHLSIELVTSDISKSKRQKVLK